MENPVEDRELSQAVIAYLGKGRSPFPRTDDEAVLAFVAEADPEADGAAMLEQVRALVEECLGIVIDWNTHDLSQGGDEAKREMAARHPELSEDALVALRWMFTYNWR